MKKQIVGVVIVALGAVGFGASAGEDPQEWSLDDCVDGAGKATTAITNSSKCVLKNKKKGDCLIRVSHTGQADWDFSSCEKHPKSMRFYKEGGGDIKCGDTVALQMGLGGENHTEWFRKCVNPQTIGINICSDEGDKPEKKHYDWQIKCTGDFAANKPFALYNISRKDAVVYAKRPSKMVDTCWSDKIKYNQCTTVRDE